MLVQNIEWKRAYRWYHRHVVCDDMWNVLVHKGLEHKDEDSKYADRVDAALDNSDHGRGSFPSKPTRLSDDLPQAGQQFTIGKTATMQGTYIQAYKHT